jgi:hypothetical protein
VFKASTKIDEFLHAGKNPATSGKLTLTPATVLP